MGDALVIAGAPAATGLNGIYYVLDPVQTGVSRVWGNAGQMRVCYDNGWTLANSADGKVYFRQTPAEKIDPWEIPVGNYTTEIEAYSDFTDLIRITRQDDDEIKKTEIATQKTYVLTEDLVFLQGKEYFTRFGEGNAASPYTYLQVEVDVGTNIPANSYYEEINVTKEITTYRNPRTNSVRTEITEKKVMVLPTTSVHDRYAAPDLSAGKVYRFTFVRDFKELGYIPPQEGDYTLADSQKDSDITRGIYKVDKVMSYYTVVMDGIDVFQNIYVPLGISEAIYRQDMATWKNDDIWYRLVNPMLPAQIYYVPTSIIAGVPDGNVKEYKRHHLITDIGIFDDPEMLAEMVTAINLVFQAKFGLDTASELTSYDSVWISTSFYEWLDTCRKNKREEFMRTQSQRYYNNLFTNEYNELMKERDRLKQQLAGYEETLNQMSS